jgi:hypothetical protein
MVHAACYKVGTMTTREEAKAAFKAGTAMFRSEFSNSKDEHVCQIHIVSKDILVEMVKKEIRKGRLVSFKQEDGTYTAYEVSEADVYDANAPGRSRVVRQKVRYEKYGSEAQTREVVQKFPWEGK